MFGGVRRNDCRNDGKDHEDSSNRGLANQRSLALQLNKRRGFTPKLSSLTKAATRFFRHAVRVSNVHATLANAINVSSYALSVVFRKFSFLGASEGKVRRFTASFCNVQRLEGSRFIPFAWSGVVIPFKLVRDLLRVSDRHVDIVRVGFRHRCKVNAHRVGAFIQLRALFVGLCLELLRNALPVFFLLCHRFALWAYSPYVHREERTAHYHRRVTRAVIFATRNVFAKGICNSKGLRVPLLQVAKAPASEGLVVERGARVVQSTRSVTIAWERAMYLDRLLVIRRNVEVLSTARRVSAHCKDDLDRTSNLGRGVLGNRVVHGLMGAKRVRLSVGHRNAFALRFRDTKGVRRVILPWEGIHRDSNRSSFGVRQRRFRDRIFLLTVRRHTFRGHVFPGSINNLCRLSCYFCLAVRLRYPKVRRDALGLNRVKVSQGSAIRVRKVPISRNGTIRFGFPCNVGKVLATTFARRARVVHVDIANGASNVVRGA